MEKRRVFSREYKLAAVKKVVEDVTVVHQRPAYRLAHLAHMRSATARR